jgi:hypothetical protein
LVQLRGRGDDALTDCLPRLGGGGVQGEHGQRPWTKEEDNGVWASNEPKAKHGWACYGKRKRIGKPTGWKLG